MKRKTQFLIYTFLLFIGTAHSQPIHERLVYSHPLTSDTPTSGEQIENINGSFLSGEGWQADTQSSQLRIHLSETLPFEGTFIINVTNFDPVSQNVSDLKQHIINLYSRIYDNNKDIFETDGSWWNIRTGSNYSAGEGMAGFKFLAAPRGIDTREEVRCIEDATWDLSQIYEFKVVWTTSHIYCYLDDQLMATFNFHGQVEPFRYILIGKDNLIWGYCAQPGPIYSNLRIYGPGFPIEDTSPPTVKCFATVSNSVLRILFDEPVDLTSATNNATCSQDVHGPAIPMDRVAWHCRARLRRGRSRRAITHAEAGQCICLSPNARTTDRLRSGRRGPGSDPDVWTGIYPDLPQRGCSEKGGRGTGAPL